MENIQIKNFYMTQILVNIPENLYSNIPLTANINATLKNFNADAKELYVMSDLSLSSMDTNVDISINASVSVTFSNVEKFENNDDFKGKCLKLMIINISEAIDSILKSMNRAPLNLISFYK